MLKERIITAVIIVAGLLLALFYLPPLVLMAVFALLVLMGGWEWANLSGYESRGGRSFYTVLLAGGLACAGYFSGLFTGELNVGISKEILRAGCTWWAIALLLVKFYPGSSSLWGAGPVRALIGFLILVPAWLAISLLRVVDDGIWVIIVAILLVVAADVGAYFAGRAFGKAKLAPKVSPGKSWAGFWGGLSLSLAIAVLIAFSWPGGLPIAPQAMLLLAAFTVLASVLGDLTESMVKRHRGIKDSGDLLPGHGGVMDRLDSLSAALPVFALGLILSGWVA